MRLCADPILPPPLEFYTYIHRTPPPHPPCPPHQTRLRLMHGVFAAGT